MSTIAPDSIRNHKEMPPPGEASQASGDQATPPPAPGMSNVAIKPPMKLNLRENTSENWKTYKQQWQNYALVIRLATEPDDYQVALFLHCLGPDALQWPVF